MTCLIYDIFIIHNSDFFVCDFDKYYVLIVIYFVFLSLHALF